MCSCFVWIVASCSSTPVATDSGVRQVVKPVSCIAVLPAHAGQDEEISRVGGVVSNVREGASYANTILRQELAGRPDVRMVESGARGADAATLAEVSAATGCDGVMVTTVYKFRQRVGTNLAVDAPASTSFDLRIYDAASQHVLWAADFSETQEALLSNIFAFGKAQSRGFKWITVEDLLGQGMRERLAECPYFKKL